MKKVLSACAAIASMAAIVLPAQAQIPTPHGGYYHGNQVYVAPPPRYEPIPNPRPGYNWAPGYWQPYGSRHNWVAGHWVAQPGYVYREPGWREPDGRWAERRWERRHGHGLRDSDGDGVPNRYDRRPHNPYRY